MDRKFNDLVTTLKDSLKQQKRNAVDITDCLLGINCKKTVYDGENQCMFRNKREQLKKCQTKDDVWRILTDYFSFFDFYIIEHIAKQLGTKSDKALMAQYKEDFNNYLHSRVFPLTIIRSDTFRKDCKEMVLKLDSAFDDCTIANLEALRGEVAKMLNLTSNVVHLYKIKKGCIQLVLLIPEFVFNDIFPLTTDQKLILQQLKITKLDCGTFHFHYKRTIQSQSNGMYLLCMYLLCDHLFIIMCELAIVCPLIITDGSLGSSNLSFHRPDEVCRTCIHNYAIQCKIFELL